MIMTWCSDKPKPAWSEILSPNKSKLKTYIKIWKGIFNEILPFHETSWLYFYLVVKFTSVCLPVYTACKNMYKCETQSMTFNIFLHLNCLKKKIFFSTFHLAYRINKPVRLPHVYVSNSPAVSSALCLKLCHP